MRSVSVALRGRTAATRRADVMPEISAVGETRTDRLFVCRNLCMVRPKGHEVPMWPNSRSRPVVSVAVRSIKIYLPPQYGQ